MALFLFITGTPANVREGSGTYVGISVLRDALIASGHRVELIVSAAHTRSALARLWFNYRARGSARIVRPDVVVGFDLDGVFLDAAGALDVACVKGVVAEELRFERGFQRAGLLLQSYFEKRHVLRAGRVLTTSRYAARGIEAHYGVAAAKIRIVPEPIDLEKWRAALDAAERERRAECGILCVAHLYPRKDIATLLRAMERLKTPATLRIAGIGPELNNLRRLSRELRLERRVHFLEHVPFARLAQEYSSADVFCLPSRQEGFGIVLLEAMAAGLPVVAARAAAIPEVMPEGRCGVLVEPGDVAGFAAALESLLGDPVARRRLGDAGREHVRRYDARRVAGEFLEAVGL